MEILEIAHALLQMLRVGIHSVCSYWVHWDDFSNLETNRPLFVKRTTNFNFIGQAFRSRSFNSTQDQRTLEGANLELTVLKAELLGDVQRAN